MCPICGKTYPNRLRLTVHERTHYGIYAYHCPLCNKGFMATNDLRGHMSWHTGVKEFKCNQCDKEFRYKQHLVRHVKTHHATSGWFATDVRRRIIRFDLAWCWCIDVCLPIDSFRSTYLQANNTMATCFFVVLSICRLFCSQLLRVSAHWVDWCFAVADLLTAHRSRNLSQTNCTAQSTDSWLF